MRVLHEVTPREVAPPIELDKWAGEAQRRVVALAHHLEPDLLGATVALLGQALPAQANERVLCHRDLSSEHVLIDPNTGLACGVIDFGDAGPSAWWHDFVGIFMWGGDASVSAACTTYGRELDCDERLLLNVQATTAAVWDVVNASEGCDASAIVAGTNTDALDEAVEVLRRVVRV